MKKKQDSIGDSPMLFMEWPDIEIDGKKITLKSSVTKITITESAKSIEQKGNHFIYPFCPIMDSRIKNSIR
jgi:hypothetical protein